ncbi:MAG: tripartite tricarboxylate transporter substrate binding protein [Deltaproteobacteria bacterium]|nr:tripartite tricarboxylate transporter substrate binding protein [Deltaproteobacteria bacterium]
MRIKETVLCAVLAVFLLSGVCPAGVFAQEAAFPTKPITIIVPFPPGGFLDLGARTIGESLSRELKTPVVVENKAGGAGLVGSLAFLNTKPDGYTLLAASGAAVISSVQLAKNPTFDPRKDLLPLAYLGDTPGVMAVGKHTPFKTFNEFVQYAKANPGKLKGAISGLGGEAHIMFETIESDAKLDSKLVPYPAIQGVITGILGGHLDWWCGTLPGVMQFQKSGDMRILLATRKIAELPGVPSGADVGLPDVSVNVWMGLFANPKTPKEVTDKLIAAVAKAVKDPEVAKKLSGTGFTLAYKPPAELAKLITAHWGLYDKVLKDAKIKAN